MNRQAKVDGGRWWNMGSVTLNRAAIMAAERVNSSKPVKVTVRDDEDKAEHEVVVERVVSYKTRSPRDDE